MSHIRFTASYSSGLVQVSSSVTFDYNVENKVSSSVTFDYNVESKVSSSVTFDYNVEEKVSNAVVFDYNVENKVSSSVTFDYNVEEKVSNAVVFEYNVEEIKDISATDTLTFTTPTSSITADLEETESLSFTTTGVDIDAIIDGQPVPDQVTFTAENVNAIAGISANDSLQFTSISAGIGVQAQTEDILVEFTPNNPDIVAVLTPVDNTLDFNVSSSISTSTTASDGLVVVCTGTLLGGLQVFSEGEVVFTTQRAFAVGYKQIPNTINRNIELVYYNTERQKFKIDIAETILVRRRKDR